MKIVVIGGGGLIGSKLVTSFRRDYGVGKNGDEVLPASRSTGVNVFTGSGLAQALAGADVVVDVANSSSFDDDAAYEFFETAGRTLLTAEAAAGSRHHVALSIVGIDRNPEAGYFRAKLAQERLIKRSGIPYTIVRSTQFFESVARITEAGALDGAVHASPALVQPVASDDVAAALAGVALAAPVNDTIEIAGPQRLPVDELVLSYLLSRRDRRPVVSDIHARYFGVELNDRSLTPDNKPRIGATRFEEWLKK